MSDMHPSGAPVLTPLVDTLHAIRRLAIVGAGREGTWLAQRAAHAGYRVILEDLMPGKRREAARQLADPAYAVTYAATVEEAVREADVVIDFVPDDLESKLEIFSMLDRMAPPHTLFATPTRTLSIADLASCTYRAEQCFGLRIDGGIAESVLPLTVEVVQSPGSGQAAAALLCNFWQKLGAQVSVTTDHKPLP